MTVKYEPEDVRAIVKLVSQDPRGFLRLVDKHCKKVSKREVVASMRAHGIDPNGSRNYEEDSSNWSSW